MAFGLLAIGSGGGFGSGFRRASVAASKLPTPLNALRPEIDALPVVTPAQGVTQKLGYSNTDLLTVAAGAGAFAATPASAVPADYGAAVESVSATGFGSAGAAGSSGAAGATGAGVSTAIKAGVQAATVAATQAINRLVNPPPAPKPPQNASSDVTPYTLGDAGGSQSGVVLLALVALAGFVAWKI